MGGIVSFPLSDQLLRPDYLDAIERHDAAALRAMRSECESAEASVSFARRVLQGRLDIVDNELEGRRAAAAVTPSESAATTGAHEANLHELIDRLPQILSGDGHGRGTSGPGWRAVDVTPDHVVVDELLGAIDAIAPVGVMSTLASLSNTDVDEVATRLRALERELSDTRHELHLRIDALKAELTARYGRGEVSVESLLS